MPINAEEFFGEDIKQGMAIMQRAIKDSKLDELAAKIDSLNKQEFKDLVDSVEQLSKPLKDSKVKTALNQFSKTVGTMASTSIMESLGVMEGLQKIIDAMTSPLQIVSPLFSVIAAIIQEAMLPTMQMLAPLIKQAADYLIEHKDSIQAVIRVTTPLLWILSAVMGDFTAIENALKTLGITSKSINNIMASLNETITKTFNKITSFFSNLGNTIGDTINGWSKKIVKALGDLVDDMVDEIEDWGDDLVEAIGEALGL